MTETSREVEKAAQENASFQKAGFLRGAISVFILFHLIAILCWAIPTDFSPMKDVKEIVRPYMVWIGLFQSWDTFAPNPKSINAYIEAVVITRNHRQEVWTFPRMEQLSFGKRYEKERYRKFAEVLPLQQNAYLWPGIAKHVVRMFDNPVDPPQMVLLIQFSAPIKPGTAKASEPAPKPRIFYEYVNYAQPEDSR